MIQLDDRLLALRRQSREWGAQLRRHALTADRDPEQVSDLVDLPVYRRAATLLISPPYNRDPLVLAGRRYDMASVVDRVVFLEECAWGDLGLILAAPGPAMAGVLVDTLGDERQKQWFFGRLADRTTWTCFALTEAERGSDVIAMGTTATARPDGCLVLTGAKRYVCNAVRANLGVIFARAGAGPFGHVAVLVDTAEPGFHAEPVDTLGVRAGQLGAITLDGIVVPPERVLGRHLPATRRGMWGWLRTFNLLRPTVASMGVGIARAATEYVRAHRRSLSAPERDRLEGLERQTVAVRSLTLAAAAAVDRDPDNGRLGSAAKVRASRLAEVATIEALRLLGPGARLDHPLLDKLARDCRAIEFMEGTSNIQRLSLFTGLVRGGFAPRSGATPAG
nr:acyl-CoA dehydrogenase family protein [Micromonospora sp. DSM 115978]